MVKAAEASNPDSRPQSLARAVRVASRVVVASKVARIGSLDV